MEVNINTTGAFFSEAGICRGQIQGQDLRALIILHELGHGLGLFAADGGKKEALNYSYTQGVIDNCFSCDCNYGGR
jgi:hypothetical protein